MKHTEHDIQSTFILWCKYNRIRYPELDLIFAIPNGGVRDAVTGFRMKREGVRAGVPDLFLPAPREPFHGIFIEMKAKGGRASQPQRDMMLALSAQGYKVVMCYSVDEAIHETEKYLSVAKKVDACPSA